MILLFQVLDLLWYSIIDHFLCNFSYLNFIYFYPFYIYIYKKTQPQIEYMTLVECISIHGK